MPERAQGRQVGNLLAALLLTGSFSRTDRALCEIESSEAFWMQDVLLIGA